MNKINITIEIKDELIEDILCTAFEGGITYWANQLSIKDKKDAKKVKCYKHEYLTKTKKKDAVMYIHDMFDDQKYSITKKSIINALERMSKPENCYTKAFRRILDETYDAYDADVVVQTACFGKVIYG
nr:hypothetical protein [uncultured Mediterranean phage uvMED]